MGIHDGQAAVMPRRGDQQAMLQRAAQVFVALVEREMRRQRVTSMSLAGVRFAIERSEGQDCVHCLEDPAGAWPVQAVARALADEIRRPT